MFQIQRYKIIIMSGLKSPIRTNTDVGDKTKPDAGGRKSSTVSKTPTHSENGVPILYAAWENVPGAIILTEFIEEITRHLATKHGRVADQIITLTRDVIERPEAPAMPAPPEGELSAQAFKMYELQVQMFMAASTTHTQSLTDFRKANERITDRERACLSDLLGYISAQLRERIKQDVPDLLTSSDIPAVMTAAMKFHAESNVKSPARIMLHAYQHHANICQKDQEELFDYHKRYVESQRVVEESGFPALTDDIESIKFVESLNPRVYHDWQTLLINREHDAQAAGDDVSPWPKTVQEAYRVAASRVAPVSGKRAQQAQADGPRPSTINAAVSRGADSEGSGGGKRNPKKTHAREPRGSSDDEVDPEANNDDERDGVKRECRFCDGVLNYLSNGKRHYDNKCPFLSMAPEHKRELLKLQGDVDSIKKAVVRSTYILHYYK